jgi:hypothetical protein
MFSHFFHLEIEAAEKFFSFEKSPKIWSFQSTLQWSKERRASQKMLHTKKTWTGWFKNPVFCRKSALPLNEMYSNLC